MGHSSERVYFLWKNLRFLPSLRGPSPPPTFVPSGAQYTLVAMAMASQREVEGIGQKRPPPLLSPTALHPFPPTPTQAQRVGCGRKRWGVREGGRQEGCEGQRGGEGQRKIRGRWERGSGGLHRGQGSLALRGEGVRSGGSSLPPPTVFSGAVTAGGWGGGAGRRGEEAAGGGVGKGGGGEGAAWGTGPGSSYLWLRPALPWRPHSRRRSPGLQPPAGSGSPALLLPSLLPSGPPSPPPSVPASRARPAAHSVSAPHPRSVGAPVSRRRAAREPRVRGRPGAAGVGGRGGECGAGNWTAATWRGRGGEGAGREGARTLAGNRLHW